MPTYILYGFRWPREGFGGIRVYAIVHNLDYCSAEYIQNANSREELLDTFRKLYAESMKKIEVQGRSLEFIEPYDPNDVSDDATIQPYAYVAVKVVELGGNSIVQSAPSVNDKPPTASFKLGVDVEELISTGHGLSPEALEAVGKLRDQVAPDEKIGWWVVYNGDPERAYDEDDEDDEDEDEDEDEEEEAVTPTAERSQSIPTPDDSITPLSKTQEQGPPVPPKSTNAQVLPIRTKQEPPRPEVKPEAVLPPPKDEKIPEPAKLKEITKKSGFRSKFFGKKL